MDTPKIFESEYRFCLILWERGPATTTELVKLCRERLEWKKSTTYTVLRRLCQRGIFQNEGGVVTSRLSREEFAARQSEEFVEQAFGGSLPKFLTAFTRRKKLTDEEVRQLQQLIDESRR